MKRIVMVGTSLRTMGGIAAVVQVYAAAGLFERFPVTYVASHCDGGALAKLRAMAGGYLRFLGLLVRGQVGLVHLHVASRASFWRKSGFFLLARLFRKPVVLHLHGGEFRIFYERECGPLRQRFIRAVFARAAHVIVLSRPWQDWVRALSGNPHVDVIGNPVLVPATVPSWEGRRAAAVLCLGRMNHGKGSYDLLQAVAALRPRATVELRLGGDGEAEQVRARARALGIDAQVHLLGWVRADAKARELAAASVFVLPSYNEGLPMSVLEAMAAGLPIVSTPVGGIPEAVSDGVEGYLVAPGDVDTLAERLALLASDPALARRMGAAARRQGESSYASAAVVPRLEQLYRTWGFRSV
jgi:glycosyltransferase involved in cell wall biosynthesis